MKQEVTADAKFMAEGISSTGHVAIYGIYFDFNKSDVKAESEPRSVRLPSCSKEPQTSKYLLWVIQITLGASITT